jgi:hypothetical protein
MSQTDDRRPPPPDVSLTSPLAHPGGLPTIAKPLGNRPANALDQSHLSAAATGDRSFLQEEFGSAAAAVEAGLVFIIISFQGEGMVEVYSAIQGECRTLGLRPKRADENVGSGFVIKEIGALIEQAEFIVCDLTHERPNVYYELGYAHGVGNQAVNTLLIAREGTKLHFDLAALRVQYYTSTETLRALLARNLAEMIRTTRSREAAPSSNSDTA